MTDYGINLQFTPSVEDDAEILDLATRYWKRAGETAPKPPRAKKDKVFRRDECRRHGVDGA